MKLTVLAVIAGAGIAQVTASPIRIIITGLEGRPNGALPLEGPRFGHAVPVPPAVATMKWSSDGEQDITKYLQMWESSKPPHMRRPCGGRMSRFRQKGIEISNAFRKTFGLPIIENHPHIHAHPYIPMNAPVRNGAMVVSSSSSSSPAPHYRHQHHPGMRVHHVHGGSFANRLHYSLMNLGRWEGRAVAFVLGCGIGVLLRMFWVLAIVTYRAIKGQREDEHEYEHVTVFEEYDDMPALISLPAYEYPVDEKIEIKEDEAPVATVAVTAEESK
ncbi:hypothetical protein GALMADRAFT_257621 [Galerina marginata CBS 339.88]|uniref:Uncharacterized protein n=1 Tax=Galerina marginata (strain CBS 339.88) TaxID=685588 RepID=A0A067SA61_GALM3|nr:hypothetical protein GALMADRAFT_257621 [Galerina marginata CBS 339.88]